MSKKRSASDDRYDDKDLLGIKVSHSETLFKEGQDVILTLKDANVLDTEEDVLENVNLVDVEKTNRNLENKLNKPEYNPFDEPEYDSLGRYKKKTLLSKYDEEINGLKKESFRIGLDESRRLEQLEEIKKAIAKEKGEVSLNVPKYKIASEYYTEEETISFKKPSKKTKKSTKKSNKQDSLPITADSLLPLGNENTDDHGNRNGNINNNFGNRSSSRKVAEVIEDEDDIVDEAFLEHQNLLQNAIKNKIKTKESSSTKKSSSDSKHQTKSSNHKSSSSKRLKTDKNEFVEIKKERPNLSDEEANRADDSDDDYQIPDEEIFGMALEEDDLQRDLMKSLDKARKLKQKERLVEELEKITETVLLLNEDEIKAESSRSIVFEERNDRVINSTAEFCRNLGDSNNLKYAKEEEELLDFERDLLEEKEEKMDLDDDDDSSFKSMRNKWSEVDFKTEQPKTVDLNESKAVILEEEPDVSYGLAGALKLAMKKGYLDKEIKKSNVSIKASSLEAKNYQIEEKFYEDDKFSRRERYNGSLMEFKEKSNYKPNVKLEYNDDNGRQLNSKEAFRVLSHKFHGKGPGKNKIDKRLKKINQETKLKLMTSGDTPLSTTKLLIEKQKELHTPYVVLSANQNILSKKPQ